MGEEEITHEMLQRLARIEAKQEVILGGLAKVEAYPVQFAKLEESIKATNKSIDMLEGRFAGIKDDAFKFVGLGGSIIIIVNWLIDHFVK